ncbi:aminoglycoside phosphotransferase family protein [Phyllobacterium sp. P30BS-XVII]|uniref:aminoglycoside phosphotransferase family protein n=1 Tax=Phyllobacterium sp. P30BS-XVII TaxID=2587046 RepID=UPI0015F81DF0|nr:aminoglycoside phosphotransferase family protein [Phyllobacterium sp. P30BS-XVII]MBA8904095.1 streptomycin 6-kinase [Phyllobacterium sp. P30BS-XVII]
MADRIPEIFPTEWQVSSPELIVETHTSRIIKVRLDNGTPAIVKALNATGVQEELRGVHYLDWHDGKGAIRVLAEKDNLLLLEYAGSRTLLDHLDEHGDDAATAIAVDVMLKLLNNSGNNRPFAPDLRPLREQFASLFLKAAIDQQNATDSLFVEAAKVVDHLLDNPLDVQPLHGDIHHENILLGDRGWLVIDPKGLLGDPMYDAANMFYNPLERQDLRASEQRIATMALTFSRAFNRDIRTILNYAMSHACLSASWHTEDENFDEAERSLTVAKAVQRVRASLD